jgi:hypothetical protein
MEAIGAARERPMGKLHPSGFREHLDDVPVEILGLRRHLPQASVRYLLDIQPFLR